MRVLRDRLSLADRVYETLRNDLKSGFYLPGDRIEASVAAVRCHTSVSPVRSGLLRLSGERLVELHAHGGFSVPHLTEVGLREQFEWNHHLVVMALHWPTFAPGRSDDTRDRATSDTVRLIETLLQHIGRRTPNLDLRRELANSNVRLHRSREIEVELLQDLTMEAPEALKAWRAGDVDRVMRFFQTKHTRRRALIPQIIERLHPSNGSEA